ncbi:AraC family transcriptional regulator [candidate division WOR-3 bacterium]|nr:AraC family transcriptional regulator [candidate division WOR-3 bacterium]
MNENQKKLIELFTGIMPDETVLATSIKGIQLFRIEHSFPRTPYAYNSEIIILGQGVKQVYLGNDVYTYDSSHYLVLPVPLPAECQGKTEPGKPILGLTIIIDPIEVGEILLDMEDIQKETRSLPKGIYSAPMSEALFDATIRLLQAIADPLDRKTLAPMIKREIIYRVLQGEKGEILQAIAHRNRRFFQIAKVLQKIHESYSNDFDIKKLAKELGMSSSTFHKSFKAVTDISPLQYIKNVRLHGARTLMIRDGLNANIAAMQVGYESSSQFNREYKRLFGVTPAKDATILRRQHMAN